MTAAPHAQTSLAPARIHAPVWAWLLAAVALFLLYLVTQDNGAVLSQAGAVAHELFHDARHSLGVPCH